MSGPRPWPAIAMELRVLETDFRATPCRTRLPFRFGIATLTEAPTLQVRVVVETAAGQRAVGHAAELLVPKWFEKDPAKSPQEDLEALAASARAAAAAWSEPAAGCASVFAHWWRVYGACAGAVPTDAPDRLVRGFGVALLERAVMDAACRAAGLAFAVALRADLFAFRPGQIDARLEGWTAATGLSTPAQRVFLRHTVGLLDTLREADLDAASRLDDGLPDSLEGAIRRHGLRWFKIKIGGAAPADRARLLAIAATLRDFAGAGARLMLDGNEQFPDLAPLLDLLEGLPADPAGAWLRERLAYVEQPLPRAASLDPAHAAGLARLARIAPPVLDEGDAGVESFPAALAVGWRGVSVKNCKGVFRALLNRAWCGRVPGAFQTGEDLTNLPVLALQQDLATQAALGMEHVERNGHHYFAGLDHLPAAEAEAALLAHPDLYERGAGRIVLRIRNGVLELGSLQRPGFGYDLPIPPPARAPLGARVAEVLET